MQRRINERGPIGFDEFMACALYHPHGGYYASMESRTGKRGDFFTSVSVGPVFGKLLAAQFVEMREALGQPEDFTIVEQGANDGQLMADILRAWPSATPRIVIIEPLPNLRELQRKTLAAWSQCLTHVAHESELPAFTGVFFANELLDAFPVKILVREYGVWFERRVNYENGRFVFVDVPFAGGSVDLPAIPASPARFVIETSPSLTPWMQTVAGKLLRGWLLLVDYGYPASVRHHPARAGGTLAAYRNHQRQEDPLAAPGTQDLTAHVDFTAVARAAEIAGLALSGFTDQHHALTALAASAFPPMATAPLDKESAKEMRALRQLLHPESMGTAFKFFALRKGTGDAPTAFRFARDPRRELFQ